MEGKLEEYQRAWQVPPLPRGTVAAWSVTRATDRFRQGACKISLHELDAQAGGRTRLALRRVSRHRVLR